MKNSIMKKTFSLVALVGLGAITFLSSCGDDDDGSPATGTPSPGTPNPPSTNFLTSQIDQLGQVDLGLTISDNYDLSASAPLSPGVFSGQTRRIAQLQEIVDSSRNEPIIWDLSAALSNEARDQFASPAAQGNSDIRTKIDELNFDNGNTSVADDFADLASRLTTSSQANFTVTAANGTAGMITTGTRRRHVSENGLEFAQILEKGLFGPLLYNQMVDDYLRPVQAGSENLDGNNESAAGGDYAAEGTSRQHAFDEAFGYFGANPLTYPNSANSSTGDGSFIANYTFDFSDELETALGVNVAQKIMDAFIFGRTVLKAGEGFGPNDETTNEMYYEAARADIKLYAEVGLAAAAYHYLNLSIADVTDPDRLHHLSEALGFIYSLGFNSEGRISASQVHNVLIALGWSSSDSSLDGIYQINLWEVTDAQMQSAINMLDESFPGFSTFGL